MNIIHNSFNGQILLKYGVCLKSYSSERRTVPEYETMYGRIHAQTMLEMEKYKYKIVSLGTSCFVRFLFGRYGLKPFKYEGEKSHPFDLCISPISSIINCIRTDFDKYLDIDYITQGTNTFHHELYDINFIHEDDLNGNLELFIERYKGRINNFRLLYTSEWPLFFIMFEEEPTINENTYKSLMTVLDMRFSNYKFIYLTTTESITPIYFDGTTSFYKFCQLPTKDYKWQTAGYADTDLGIEFDLKTIEYVKKIIETTIKIV